MKITLLIGMCFLFLMAACADGQADSAYCKAVRSAESTNGVEVRNLRIYGTLQHGTIVISSECLRPVFHFSSFGIAVPVNSEIGYRIREFNTAVYNKPSKKSGMFEIDGVVDVFPDEKLVRLKSIDSFREMDEGDSRKMLDALYDSRNSAATE